MSCLVFRVYIYIYIYKTLNHNIIDYEHTVCITTMLRRTIFIYSFWHIRTLLTELFWKILVVGFYDILHIEKLELII